MKRLKMNLNYKLKPREQSWLQLTIISMTNNQNETDYVKL